MTNKRGFASWTKEKRIRIAALGGRTAHALKRGHEWTSEEAREAGRKGGKANAERNSKKVSER